MQINDIFFEEQYSEAMDALNKLNAIIIEIEPNINGKRQFKLIDNSKFSEENLARAELINLSEWFDEYYTEHEQKYRRLHSLNKLTDEGNDPYNELIKLYNEAEIKRARIQELERLLSVNSK